MDTAAGSDCGTASDDADHAHADSSNWSRAAFDTVAGGYSEPASDIAGYDCGQGRGPFTATPSSSVHRIGRTTLSRMAGQLLLAGKHEQPRLCR